MILFYNKYSGMIVIIILVFINICSVKAGNDGKKLYNVQHMLDLEAISSFSLGSNGDNIALEYMSPYQYGYGIKAKKPEKSIILFQKQSGKKFIENKIIRYKIPRGVTKFISFSPSGEKLAFYWLSETIEPEFKIGIYDFKRDIIEWIPGQPHWLPDWAGVSWLADDTIFYNLNTLGDSSLPFPEGLLREVRIRTNSEWKNAMVGEKPTIKTAYSYDDSNNQRQKCRPGRFIKFDLKKRVATVIAEHAVEHVRVLTKSKSIVGLAVCGDVQLRGKTLNNKQETIRYTPIMADGLGDSSIKYLCDKCGVKYDSLFVSPDEEEVAFIEYDDTGTPQSARISRVRLKDGAKYHYSLEGIRLMALDERVEYRFRSPILWLGQDLLVYAANEKETTGERHGAYKDAMLHIRRDWYRLSGSKGVFNITQNEEKTSIVPLLSDGEQVLFLDNGKIKSINYLGKEEVIKDIASIGYRILPNSVYPEYFSSIFKGIWVPKEYLLLEKSLGSGKGIFLFDIDKNAIEYVLKIPYGADVISISKNMGAVLWRNGSNNQANYGVSYKDEISLTERTDNLMHINKFLKNVEFPEKIKVHFSDPYGKDDSACLILPPSYRHEKGKFPTIVRIYPTISDMCANVNPSVDWTDPQLDVEQGYAVLYIGIREGFRSPHNKNFNDIRSWVYPAIDEAVRLGYVDEDRLILSGISQGSFFALELLTLTTRFRAAIIAHGAANYTSLWGGGSFLDMVVNFGRSFPMGAMVRFEDPSDPLWLGAAPWEEPSSYTRISPIYKVDKIYTPILFVHTDLDEFSVQHFLELYTALYRQGRMAKMLLYSGEMHGISSPSNIIDVRKRVAEWLEEFVD